MLSAVLTYRSFVKVRLVLLLLSISILLIAYLKSILFRKRLTYTFSLILWLIATYLTSNIDIDTVY